MKLVLNHINVKHQNHLNRKYAEIKFIIFGLCMLWYCIWIFFFFKLGGLPPNILCRLNSKTGRVNCHICLPFEVPKCLSSSQNHILQLWKGAPCLLALYYYCTALHSSLICVNQHKLFVAVSTFILVTGMARCLDMGLLL